jgi:glycosyltransferase involved in cell wall biosynthesis
MRAPADQMLRIIAVDLTPVLPGGKNGGAKVFVLELIRRLAELAPKTEFILLTQEASHAELATLDSRNVRRIMVLANSHSPHLRDSFVQVLTRIFEKLPRSMRSLASRAGFELNSASRRSLSNGILRYLNADLLFCPFTAPTYAEAATPTVSVIYDLQYKTYPEFFSPEDVAQRNRTFVEASKRSTMLTAISEYSRRVAIEQGGLNPAKIKTVHIHIAKHSLRNAEQDHTILDRLALTRQKYIIYPANFWKHKNHEMLLAAFGMARRLGLAHDVKLVCTGEPGERQICLKRMASSLGLEQCTIFPGYLSNPQLLALMTGSCGVIFPSLYEGFGMPVVEAMAIGIPVACSSVTSLPEVAGNAAILFDPRVPEQIADAIISLAQDSQLTARLKKAGDIQAARFSDSTVMAQEYWEVFRQAASAGVQTSMLFGAYPDGWSGPRLTLQIASSSGARRLEVEVTLPSWAPGATVAMTCYRKGRKVGECIVLRGKTAVLSVSLLPAVDHLEIKLDPPFVLARTGLSSDPRELTALVKRCAVVDARGDVVTLFP